MDCPACGEKLVDVNASHDYSISYVEAQEKWVKSVGEVSYSCRECGAPLGVHEIEDILKQVDEL